MSPSIKRSKITLGQVFYGLIIFCVAFQNTKAQENSNVDHQNLENDTLGNNAAQIKNVQNDNSHLDHGALQDATTTWSNHEKVITVLEPKWESSSMPPTPENREQHEYEDTPSEILPGNSENIEANTTSDPNTFQEPHKTAPQLREDITDMVTSSSSIPPLEHIRVVLLGRSGFGVSSTIRQLIGTVTKCEKVEGTETLQDIFEYTISNIPGTNTSIKLLDLPGFVDGRTVEMEAQILATLKSYISKASNGSPPDFFLALSGFDDNRFVGVHSLFVQFLKRVELFENEFLKKISGKDMNIIFLLTKLMSETKTNQRRPTNKINNFRNVIKDYTSFPPPFHIIVGDNHAKSEYDAKEVDGYYLLPNKELYPKNIWEAMINLTSSHETSTKLQINDILTTIKENRKVEMACKSELIRGEWGEFGQYNADVDAFLYLLQQKNLTVEDTEVNQKIQEVFDKYPQEDQKIDGIIQKTALQLNLQNENITSIEAHIPKTHADRAALFQKSDAISSTYAASLLLDAFGLEMAEYIKPLVVGYGYDVLADDLTLETPFKTVRSLPSPIGYQIPNFMNCKRFPFKDTLKFQSFSQNISDYFTERLKYLHFEPKEDNVTGEFIGRAKDGYNLAPEEGVEIATLTAAKEIRTLKCVLAEKENREELNEEFMEAIDSLQPVNIHNRDSVNDWISFLKKYGTHIVVQGYGGGRMVGSIIGTNVWKVYNSNDPTVIKDTLDSILDFSPFSIKELERPSYQLFGGEIEEANNQINQLHDLREDQRDKLLGEWEKSLNSNFDMLKDEFILERISTIVKEKVGNATGEMVDIAIGLALRGELKYQRKRNPSKSGNNTGRPTRKPTTTTTSTSRYPAHEESTSTDYNAPQYTLNTSTTETSYKPSYGYTDRTNTADTNHEEMMKRIREQMEQEAASAKAQLDDLRRKDEEANKKHKLDMEELEKQSGNWLAPTTTEPYNSPGYYPGNNSPEKTDTSETFYDQMIREMKERIEREKAEGKARLAELQRMNEESNRRHQLEMGEVEKHEAMKKRYEKHCSGIIQFNPRCWTVAGFHRPNIPYCYSSGVLYSKGELEEKKKVLKKASKKNGGSYRSDTLNEQFVLDCIGNYEQTQ